MSNSNTNYVYDDNTNMSSWYSYYKVVIKELYQHFNNFFNNNDLYISCDEEDMYFKFVRFIFKHSPIYIDK